jgi:hypothetical protein
MRQNQIAQTGKTSTYITGDNHPIIGCQIARPTAVIPNKYNVKAFFTTFTPFNSKLKLLLERTAQRLAAQPLGHIRLVVTILAGNLKSQSSVLSLSLGQVGCSRVLSPLHFHFTF